MGYLYLGIPETKFIEKNFICGGMSKITTTFATYPLTTVRTRVHQDQYFLDPKIPKYKNVVFFETFEELKNIILNVNLDEKLDVNSTLQFEENNLFSRLKLI